MTRPLALALAALAALALAAAAPAAEAAPGCTRKSLAAAALPDLQTVVPKHVSLQNAGGRETLRFTNGIANRGAGPWRLRPERLAPAAVAAVQEVLDAAGTVVCEEVVGVFEFHQAHNHWHIGDVALFEVRVALDDGTGGLAGPVLRNDRGTAQSAKVSFCLIDWYRLDANSPTTERTYWDCVPTAYQGISPGWVDQYHHSLEGQEIDITGAPAGVYYFVSTANPDGNFLEVDRTNNTAWTSYRLSRDSKGNAKLTLIATSPCDSPGMCGEQKTNR